MCRGGHVRCALAGEEARPGSPEDGLKQKVRDLNHPEEPAREGRKHRELCEQQWWTSLHASTWRAVFPGKRAKAWPHSQASSDG